MSVSQDYSLDKSKSPKYRCAARSLLAMTIGVGFMCRDGVVIAADRKVTNRNNYTFNEKKVTSFHWSNGRAIGVYAGNIDIAKKFAIALSKHSSGAISAQEFPELLGRVLKGIKVKSNFQTLFGAWVDGENTRPNLYISSGTDVLPAGQCEIIGVGDSPLTRYLRGIFNRVPLNPTIQQAVAFAVYFVMQTKKYDGEFCGGGTDVWIIDKDRRIGVFDTPQTEAWEKELDLIEFKTHAVFRLLSDRELSEQRAQIELQEFETLLRRFCNFVIGKQ